MIFKSFFLKRKLYNFVLGASILIYLSAANSYADNTNNQLNIIRKECNYNRELSKEDKDKIIKKLDKEVENSNKRALFERANCFYSFEEYQKSIADITSLLKEDLGYVDLLYKQRGLGFEKLGKLNLALADFTRAIEYNKNIFTLYIERAEIYKKLRNNDEAIRDYKAALSLLIKDRPCELYGCRGYGFEEVKVYMNLLSLLYKNKSQNDYDLILKEAIKRNPDKKEKLLGSSNGKRGRSP